MNDEISGLVDELKALRDGSTFEGSDGSIVRAKASLERTIDRLETALASGTFSERADRLAAVASLQSGIGFLSGVPLEVSKYSEGLQLTARASLAWNSLAYVSQGANLVLESLEGLP